MSFPQLSRFMLHHSDSTLARKPKSKMAYDTCLDTKNFTFWLPGKCDS